MNSRHRKVFLFRHKHTKLKTQFCKQFRIFTVTGKNTLLFVNIFFLMSNFVHSCLTKNFIKLGGVLSLAMTLNIIFFHNYSHILADEEDNTWICGTTRYLEHHSLENSFFIINLSFLGCRHFIVQEVRKIAIYYYEVIKIKSDAFIK